MAGTQDASFPPTTVSFTPVAHKVTGVRSLSCWRKRKKVCFCNKTYDESKYYSSFSLYVLTQFSQSFQKKRSYMTVVLQTNKLSVIIRDFHFFSTDTVEDEDHEDESHRRGVIFTSNGTRTWWLFNPANNSHFILTQDQSRLNNKNLIRFQITLKCFWQFLFPIWRILCAHTVGGLRIDWFENTISNRQEDWCQWDIETHPGDPALFRMKNHVFIDTVGVFCL